MPDKRSSPSEFDAKADGAKRDGPPEIEDAAEQELEYPEDTTDEG